MIDKQRKAFLAHKYGAKKRGIEFKFSCEEWCAWWDDALEKAGPGSSRGTRHGQLGMCRFGDAGAYEAGNVFAGTQYENSLDREGKLAAYRLVQHLVNAYNRFCPRCEEVLPVACFGVYRARGIAIYCKSCSTKSALERRFADPEEHRQYRREYAKDHKEDIMESHRKWREKNREHYNEYQRNWRNAKKTVAP